jgi:hypothetical protein
MSLMSANGFARDDPSSTFLATSYCRGIVSKNWTATSVFTGNDGSVSSYRVKVPTEVYIVAPFTVVRKKGDFPTAIDAATTTAPTTTGDFGLASTSTSAPGGPSNTSSPAQHLKLQTGAKVGIGVGVAFGVIVLLVLAIPLWKRHIKRREPVTDRWGMPELSGDAMARGQPAVEIAENNVYEMEAESKPVEVAG